MLVTGKKSKSAKNPSIYTMAKGYHMTASCNALKAAFGIFSFTWLYAYLLYTALFNKNKYKIIINFMLAKNQIIKFKYKKTIIIFLNNS